MNKFMLFATASLLALTACGSGGEATENNATANEVVVENVVEVVETNNTVAE